MIKEKGRSVQGNHSKSDQGEKPFDFVRVKEILKEFDPPLFFFFFSDGSPKKLMSLLLIDAWCSRMRLMDVDYFRITPSPETAVSLSSFLFLLVVVRPTGAPSRF
jgi:hypothetical protein